MSKTKIEIVHTNTIENALKYHYTDHHYYWLVRHNVPTDLWPVMVPGGLS